MLTEDEKRNLKKGDIIYVIWYRLDFVRPPSKLIVERVSENNIIIQDCRTVLIVGNSSESRRVKIFRTESQANEFFIKVRQEEIDDLQKYLDDFKESHRQILPNSGSPS